MNSDLTIQHKFKKKSFCYIDSNRYDNMDIVVDNNQNTMQVCMGLYKPLVSGGFESPGMIVVVYRKFITKCSLLSDLSRGL